MKIRETATVISQECLCENVFSVWIATKAANSAECGQFVSVFSKDGSRLLPRPISICEIGNDRDSLRLVYRIAGAGTREFSKLKAGDGIDILGPNGNGFPSAAFSKVGADTKALLVGGGIGIPPMLALAKELTCPVTVVAGYKDQNSMFLTEDLKKAGTVYFATDDGSFGTKGTVIDAIKENGIDCDIIFACGPLPMLKGIKRYSEEIKVPAFISMEERMACSVGACLGCVVRTTKTDEHSKVANRRVCVDGPVFDASEVDI